ncbi:hypothetical protein LG293_17360 (plasmid) [Citricoccus nitrophenolicus]
MKTKHIARFAIALLMLAGVTALVVAGAFALMSLGALWGESMAPQSSAAGTMQGKLEAFYPVLWIVGGLIGVGGLSLALSDEQRPEETAAEQS